jgi:hypothetical protein
MKKVSRLVINGRGVYLASALIKVSTGTRGFSKSKTAIRIPEKRKATKPFEAVEAAREEDKTVRKNIKSDKAD